MKIWQKVFLITLLLVTIFLFLIGILLSNHQLDTELEKDRQSAGNFHRELALLCQSQFEENKNEQGHYVLDDTECEAIIDKVIHREEYRKYGIKVQMEGTQIWLANESYQGIVEKQQEFNSGLCRIVKVKDTYYLVVSSTAHLSGRYLNFITEWDITDTYQRYDVQMNRLRKLCVLLSALSALILLIVVKILLSSIKKVRKGIHTIAQGQYGTEMPVRGNTEITDLVRDVNNMSGEIGKRMQEKDEILENRRIFVGDMAHEMKTPLTAILAFSDILTIKPDLTEEKRLEYSEYIRREAKRMKEMSGKLLELIQLQGDKLELKKVSLNTLFSELLEVERSICADKQIQIQADICECEVKGDADLLKSLFYNLIDNAKKASEYHGKILIHMEKEKERVKIQVTDYGAGIPPEEIRRITEPFYMVDKSRSRKAGGAGLGLALCQEIIRLHRGRLDIQSQVGQGSTFTVSIPAAEDKDK